MTVSEKKWRVVLKIFGMYTLIVVMICPMAYIKCQCVIHTVCVGSPNNKAVLTNLRIVFKKISQMCALIVQTQIIYN